MKTALKFRIRPLPLRSAALQLISILFFAFAQFLTDASEGEVKLSKREKAQKVIELTKIHQIYVDTLLSTLEQTQMSKDDKALVRKIADPEKLRDAFLPVYLDFYSEEELDAMILFYSSDAGASIISKSQDLAEKLRAISIEWQNLLNAELREGKNAKEIPAN